MEDDDQFEVMTPEEIEEESREYHLYGSLGLFISAFSKVELVLTVIMANLCKYQDFDTFHVITRGLDARAKVGRIRNLCETGSLIVPESHFDVRLNLFQHKINDFRNKIAHSYISLPSSQPILAFYDITYFNTDPKEPEYVASQEALDLYTYWAEDFFNDLLPVVRASKAGKELTIDRPQSLEPQEFHQKIDALNRAAKRDMLPKVAIRKDE